MNKTEINKIKREITRLKCKPHIKLFFCYGKRETDLIRKVKLYVYDNLVVEDNLFTVVCKDWRVMGAGSNVHDAQERYDKEILKSTFVVFVIGTNNGEGIKHEVELVKNSLFSGRSEPGMLLYFSERSEEEISKLKIELQIDDFKKITYGTFLKSKSLLLSEEICRSVRDWYNCRIGKIMELTDLLSSVAISKSDYQFVIDTSYYLLEHNFYVLSNKMENSGVNHGLSIEKPNFMPSKIIDRDLVENLHERAINKMHVISTINNYAGGRNEQSGNE